MTVATKKRKPGNEGAAVFDRELEDLPQDLRWREWMGRIEAVLFASASPVGRDDLARVVGQGASVEILIDDKSLAFTEMEMGVLCAIAYHQPIDRAGLKDIFGKDVSRDLLARLRFKDLIASGPRSPRAGAPHTFVTTEKFLATFDLQSLRDLPELELSVF